MRNVRNDGGPNRDLKQQCTAWRQRRLQEHWRILSLDGIHFSVRHGDQVDSTLILTALGVGMAGNKEVLATAHFSARLLRGPGRPQFCGRR
jgi:transposase-like protein